MAEPIYDDPVVAEIHSIRAKMLADCGGDHRKLMENVREHQQASGRQIISTPLAPQHRTEDSTEVTDNAMTSGESSPAAR